MIHHPPRLDRFGEFSTPFVFVLAKLFSQRDFAAGKWCDRLLA